MNRQQQIDSFVAQAHRLAIERLREHPERIREVLAQLAYWRSLAGHTRSDAYWDEWAQLFGGPAEALATAVCADTDRATVMRSMSPMSVLITQAERAHLLLQARQAV